MSCLQCGHYLTVAEEAYIQLKARVVFARDRINQLDSLTPELVMVKQYISEAAKHLDVDTKTAAKWFNLAVWNLGEHTGQIPCPDRFPK